MHPWTSPLELPTPSLAPTVVPEAVTVVGLMVLALVLLLRERASRESLSFLLLALFVAVWQGSFAAMYVARDAVVAEGWARAAYLGIPFIPAAIYQFSTQLLGVYERRRSLVRTTWILAGLSSAAILWTDAIVVGVYQYSWGYYPRYGWGGVPYLAFFGGTLLLAMREYRVQHRRVQLATYRGRIRWQMIAFGIAYLAVLDYLPVYGIGLAPFGFLPVLVFMVMMAWAMRFHRLVDLTPSLAADQILATMADPLIVVDAGGRIRIVNEAMRSVLGFDPEEVTDLPLGELAVPGSPEAERLRALCLLPTARDEEMRLRSRGGETVEVSVSSSPLHDPKGERVGTVIIARDVRERRRAEDALRRNEERFRALIENISDAILVLDAQGTVTFASASLVRVIGYTPEERVGGGGFDLIHPEDQPRVREAFVASMANPGVTMGVELRARHRDGTWRDLEARATNLLHHPAVAGLIIAYHDATERRRAQEALRESEEALLQSQKMEAVGALAGGVAHDFNNLLTIIGGNAELLRCMLADDPDAETMLREIQEAGRRASSLTRQLLAFSRKQVLQPRVIDLNASVAGMEQMLRRLIGEDVDCLVCADPAAGRVKADPGQMEQVLLNLAVNARDAMPGGGRLTIETSAVRLEEAHLEVPAGRYVQLSVADDGCGMSRELQERIFEPFFTTKEQGKGTGLGLSTVYGIVKQSGGYISVESEEGRGTTVRVLLPQVDGQPQAEEGSGAPAAEPRRDAVVLLVEDDQGVRTLARQVLRRQGYAVLEAVNGREALRLCDEHPGEIDLLLTDVVMPEMSGRELSERFTERRPGTRVVYMSGYTDDAILRHGVLEAEVPFLEKPFSPDALARLVAQTLEEGETFPSLVA